jgi:AcrR family transcriptional regulator
MAYQEDAQSLRDRIVDTAIDLAEQEGWEGLRLRKVAERCGVDLIDVLSQFRDIDAVADAWCERALAAMLSRPPAGLVGLPNPWGIKVEVLSDNSLGVLRGKGRQCR